MSESNPFEQRGKDYRPFLQVHRVPSKGICSRLLGSKTHRIHHTLSLIETKCLYLFEFAPYIKDIREQFPLPLNRTQQIADTMGVIHPRKRVERTTTYVRAGRTTIVVELGMQPVEMTTDFVLTLTDDSLLAISVKYEKDCQRRRVREKLLIERRFWDELGVPYMIATERSINPHLVQNLRWMHNAVRSNLPPDTTQDAKALMEEALEEGMTLGAATRHADAILKLPLGSGLQVARHLLRTKQWLTDLTKPINPGQHLKLERSQP